MTRTARDFFDVSVVAACGGRGTTLRAALPSWAATGARDIVLVDWSSESPLGTSLDLHDPRTRIVRVEDQPAWRLSWAYNVAFANAKFAKVLKVDCDTVLSPDFFEAHPLRPGVFYAGDWREARSREDVHLNGVLYAHASDFWGVNGYDERIQSYGWDDSDMHQRLERLGLVRRGLRLETIRHTPHPPASPDLWPHNKWHLPLELLTQRNRVLAQSVAPWSPSFRRNTVVVAREEHGTSPFHASRACGLWRPCACRPPFKIAWLRHTAPCFFLCVVLETTPVRPPDEAVHKCI